MSVSLPGEEIDDQTLLRRWVESGDGGAVRILTERHAGLVLGTAARALSGNQILAEEAAQTVFTVMAVKAASLQDHPSLGLWLHRAALLEASGLRRREARRHQHLARLAEELETMNSPESTPEWQRALPELDEALERLPGSDRQLLILRYYEGRNFRDIASRLGKSDDTVQKQASRAVEKLSRLLRCRGIVIPAAVLGAGLTGLTPKVPAAVTAKLAAAAVAHAPHFGVISGLSHSLKLMTYTHSTSMTAGAALLLLLLCGFSGYRSGGASVAAGSAARDDHSAEVSRKPAETTPRPPPGGWPGPGHWAGTAGRSAPPLREVLKAAASIEMGINGEWSRFSESAYPVLGHYDIADTEEAIALLPEFSQDNGKFESVAGLIFNVLADKDWRKARDRLMKGDVLRGDGKLSGQGIRLVAEAWGREDPAAAFQWANGLVDEGRTPFPADRGVGERLLTSWLQRDPETALAEMNRRVENQTRLVGFAVRSSLRHKAQWWIDGLAPEAPPEDRSRMLRLARSAMVMIPDEHWEEMLTSFTKDSTLAGELLRQLKPKP